METRRLGRTDIDVSLICLGTMTWGQQNTEAEGHEQMDYAVGEGIDFFDTAEIYAVPPTAESFGRTEEIIGTWFKASGGRDRITLATKAVGPTAADWVRDGSPRLDEKNIVAAAEASLKRLQTDYIDLYQVHWPNRTVNKFGQLGFVEAGEEDFVHPGETLSALGKLVDQGKVRHIGVSNESAWGLMTYLSEVELTELPRIMSIQNAYSLLNRSFEVGLSEVATREQVSLLAYSPLGGGTLSGKYLDGAVPKGSRRDFDSRSSRYITPNADPAVRRYISIADRHGLDPCQMSIAYVNSRPFVTSTIIGATSMDQLKTNIAAADVTLSDDVLGEIEAAHHEFTVPCP
jgi:aryl-alcohol dehydrogenase-like predicted oxidoreductase